MMKKSFLLLGSLIVVFVCFTDLNAQLVSADKGSMSMTGEFGNDGATGSFTIASDEQVKQNWSVFLGTDDKVYKAIFADKKIVEFFVDGQKIADDDISQYASATKPFLENLSLQEEIEKQEKELEDRDAELDRQEEEIDKVSDKLDDIEDKLDNIRGKRTVDLADAKENLSKLRERNSKLRDSISAKRDSLSIARDIISEKIELINNHNEIYKVLEKIISDLRTAGIINGSRNISFKLSNRELIVNGKRQSGEIHQRLKEKYVVDLPNETGFLYRWKLRSN